MTSINIDTACEALAEILFYLIDLNETGPVLINEARAVEDCFRRTDTDFGKMVIKELKQKRKDFYSSEE